MKIHQVGIKHWWAFSFTRYDCAVEGQMREVLVKYLMLKMMKVYLEFYWEWEDPSVLSSLQAKSFKPESDNSDISEFYWGQGRAGQGGAAWCLVWSGVWSVRERRCRSERMTRCCPLPLLSLSLSTDSVLEHWTNQPDMLAPHHHSHHHSRHRQQRWSSASSLGTIIRLETSRDWVSIRKYGDTSTCLFVAVLIFYKALKYCLAVWPGSNNLKTASIVCEINPDFCKINRMDSLKLSFFFFCGVFYVWCCCGQIWDVTASVLFQ